MSKHIAVGFEVLAALSFIIAVAAYVGGAEHVAEIGVVGVIVATAAVGAAKSLGRNQAPTGRRTAGQIVDEKKKADAEKTKAKSRNTP